MVEFRRKNTPVFLPHPIFYFCWFKILFYLDSAFIESLYRQLFCYIDQIFRIENFWIHSLVPLVSLASLTWTNCGRIVKRPKFSLYPHLYCVSGCILGVGQLSFSAILRLYSMNFTTSVFLLANGYIYPRDYCFSAVIYLYYSDKSPDSRT